MIDLIAFDADDTLWHNESYYTQGRENFRQVLRAYEIQDFDDRWLDEIEIRNLPYYGYGATGFALSLIEAAIALTGGEVRGHDLQRVIDFGKKMLSADVELFDHVEETIGRIADRYPLMLITKGDLRHQQAKVDHSGLKHRFQHVEIVSEKKPEVYAEILARHNVDPSRFLMVGNSLRSDILPVIELGGWAVYIPNGLTWAHENNVSPVESQARYFELERIDLLPDLLQVKFNSASKS